MKSLPQLFENNQAWAASIEASHPGFFAKLAHQQAPKYCWIGCSDSRVPANEICGLNPGELFVHRNVANVVVHTDINCLSVLQYAVEVLRVEHVIVCGHYGCGGVRAALGNDSMGLVSNWLRHIKDVYDRHRGELQQLREDPKKQVDRLCELNVATQVRNVCHTAIVQEAWARGQTLFVHGWIYGLHDGCLKDLGVTVQSEGELESIYRMEVSSRPPAL